MSVSAKKKSHFLEDLAYRIRGVALTYHDQILSENDSDVTHEVLTLWCCILCDLLSSGSSPTRQYQCTVNRILAEWQTRGLDVLSFIIDLTDIDACMVDVAGHDSGVSCFKHRIRNIHVSNHWLVGVCSDILAAYNEPVQMWSALHQLLRFPVRLRLEDVTELESKTAEKYFENLNRVSQLSSSTDVEQAIIARWFEYYAHPTIDDCSFGSGATSNPHVKSIEEKYSQLIDTARSKRIARSLGIEPTAEVAVRQPRSRLIFVPKNAKIMRPIAAEDPMLMFYQQGILRSLDRMFHSPLLQRRITLENQTRSRKFAQAGSLFPSSYATIDLSSASDSVRVDHVEKWFARTPLSRALHVCRSTTAAYNGKIIDLPMFASMGSAVCFPIECICFAAQCAATILSEGDSPSHSNYCVYGDDIIIESKYAPALMARLEHNGFLVNKEKSFFQEDFYFREACGGEYLHGVDVTPLYLSRRFTTRKSARPRMMSALILMANACFARNLMLSRSYVLRLLRDWYGNTIPFSDNLELIRAETHFHQIEDTVHAWAIFSPTATNFHLTTRYNRRLQRREYRVLSVTAQPMMVTGYEVGRYYYTLHKPENDVPGCEPRGDARVTARTRLVLRRTWRNAI